MRFVNNLYWFLCCFISLHSKISSLDFVSLNDWLKRRAFANQKNNASRTYVVTSEQKVIAYYCLSSGALALSDTPSPIKRNMPDLIHCYGKLATNRTSIKSHIKYPAIIPPSKIKPIHTFCLNISP